MMSLMKKAALLLSISVAVVILLLASNGFFNHNDAVENLRHHVFRTPQGSIDQTTLTNQIKDFAVDKTVHEPSRWIRLGKHKFEGAPILPKDVIDHVQKFIFFIGYPRSGHSILGSLMDAHPHIVIANEFLLFRNWKYYSDRQKDLGENNPFFKHKNYLFNILYRRSYWDTLDGFRSEQNTKKNYTLSMDSLWQGKFNKYVSVIGDKSGGVTASIYLSSNTTFARYLDELRTTVKIPVKAIHVVRNPFDQISTCALYKDYDRLSDYTEMALEESSRKMKVRHTKSVLLSVSNYKAAMTALQVKGDNKTFIAAKYNGEKRLEYCIGMLTKRASAVSKITDLIGPSNVIEVHGADLVNDPKAVMRRVCSSLEVECTPDYLQACANKVFKSASRTRDMLVWSPNMKGKVEEELIHTYPFFNRYSLETE